MRLIRYSNDLTFILGATLSHSSRGRIVKTLKLKTLLREAATDSIAGPFNETLMLHSFLYWHTHYEY